MFPRWANLLLPVVLVAGLGAAAYVPTVVYLGFSPLATDVGYQPEQPIPYSHALHAGQLNMDCRYCHTTVQEAGFAAIPSPQTCMNCHSYIKVNNADGTPNRRFEPLWDAWDATWRERGVTYTSAPAGQPRVEGKPLEWVKVHDLPDFAYFNHSAHTNKGVGCVNCHGRIDQMDVVYQAKPLSMGWCLDCHRQPENFLGPQDQITNLGFRIENLGDRAKEPRTTDQDVADAAAIRAANNLGPNDPITQQHAGNYYKQKLDIRDRHYMTSCSTCHR